MICTYTLAIAPALAIARIILIAAALCIWYLTQWLLSKRNPTGDCAQSGTITDGIHQLTAPINRRLNEHPRSANALLIVSSLVIDLLGFYLLGSAIIGPTIQPFLGLFLLFALRQICQAFCPLPAPAGMIWRKTGFPTVLVTYGTSTDLFFSGHTAIAVFGAVTLAAALGHIGIVIGALIMIVEIGTVLVLRAHYTMDVFTGAITALYVHQLAIQWSPAIDGWIGHALKLVPF